MTDLAVLSGASCPSESLCVAVAPWTPLRGPVTGLRFVVERPRR